MLAGVSSVIALALCASASILPRTSGSCNTGPVSCCNSLQDPSKSKDIALVLGLLGIPIDSVTGQVGVSCTPVTGVGASGTTCTAQEACCTNNSYNGVVALDCTPVHVNT